GVRRRGADAELAGGIVGLELLAGRRQLLVDLSDGSGERRTGGGPVERDRGAVDRELALGIATGGGCRVDGSNRAEDARRRGAAVDFTDLDGAILAGQAGEAHGGRSARGGDLAFEGSALEC